MGLPRTFIQKAGPRALEDFGLSFTEGLFSTMATGILTLIFGIFCLIIAIIKIRFFYPFLMIGLVIACGCYMIYSAKKTVKIRQLCFLQGKIITAKVIEQTRVFNPFKSGKDYGVVVEFTNGNKEKVTKLLKNKHKSIWAEHVIGAEIIGFTYQKKSFFAEELGFTFKFYKD